MNIRLWLAGGTLAIAIIAAVGFFSSTDRSVAIADEPSAAAASLKPGNGFMNQSPVPAPNREIAPGGRAPVDDDTLLLAYPDDPDTVNPITANDTVSEALMREVYESLAEREYSNPDVFKPMLAESWEYDAANREYTIHLRKGVKWQPITLPSGKELPPTEVTARDVKFTFDVILNKYIEDASQRSYYEDHDAADKEHPYKIKVSLVPGDKYAVKIKWLKPYFQADEFTLGVAIIPRHVFSVDRNGDRISLDVSSEEFAKGFNHHWCNQQMCGTGPLIFKQWKKNERVVLERNPNYWGAPFYFSKLVYRCISNPNTSLQEMLQNRLDWSAISEKDLYFQSLDNPNVVAGKVKPVAYDYPAYRYIGYNEKREFFKDKRVRWAMSHAVPVDEIIQTIYHGLATRISGPFLPGSPSNDPALKPIDFDLDKARALLDEAGWKVPEGESIRKKTIDGSPVDAAFQLLIIADSPSFESIATIFKDNCRRIGVRVEIMPAKWSLMLDKMNKKDFDAVILGWAMAWKDDPYQIWDSSQAEVPNSSNSIGYQNTEADKIIADLRVTMDPAKQTDLYRRFDRIIYDDQPYTFLFEDKATAGYDARLKNVNFYKIRPCIDIREWYSTKPRMLGE
ncbi:MAG TPA: ABC transporter substrate-binding protein [Pirellulales bacterium]|nr:ABC transporter substrate-binding protein [Pirellulales bacterium]